jgi:membrane-associated protease RseP (regulator of RpoE activity)
VKIGDKIPVEPLDDIRLQNLERRVVARAGDAITEKIVLARPRWSMAFALVAVLVVAAGVAGWMLRGRSVTPSVVATAEPITVKTGAERSTLDIGDATIESDPNTDFTVTRPDGKVVIAMTRGRVELDVEKRNGRPPLIVRAGDTDVVVVGTHFVVDFGDGTGEVDVSVSEGIVRVERPTVAAASVAAGQAWTTKHGVLAMADLPPGGPLARHGMAIDYGLKERVAVVPDPHVPPQVKKEPIKIQPRPPVEDVVEDLPVPDPAKQLEGMIQRQKVEPAMNVGTVDGTRAMAKYREILTTQKGEPVAYALYSMAVTQHLKLGRDSDALSTIDALMRRFNTSDYHLAALWLRTRILCLRKVDDRCRAAADAYMQKADDGTVTSNVAEVITLTGTTQ